MHGAMNKVIAVDIKSGRTRLRPASMTIARLAC
jgi:hypothetical protein